MPPAAATPDLFRLEGMSAVITGAGSGIGRATAVMMARRGAARLVLGGRSAAKLAEVAAEVAATTGSGATCAVEWVAADLSTSEGRTELAAKVGSLPLHVLVNCAGIFAQASLHETSDSLWRRIFSTNVEAPLALTRLLLAPLAAAKGSVVNISSTLSHKPIADASAYNASKAALDQMTRSLALELAPKHIRVNAVLPAIVDTPMYRQRFASDEGFAAATAQLDQLHPLGRIGQADDVAAAVSYLASPAASWITGVLLPVDGGMLCT